MDLQAGQPHINEHKELHHVPESQGSADLCRKEPKQSSGHHAEHEPTMRTHSKRGKDH